MSGFVCPHCNKETFIFNNGGCEKLAGTCNIPFLGSIPIEPTVGTASDEGVPFLMTHPDSITAERLRNIINNTIKNITNKETVTIPTKTKEDNMKIAIPVVNNTLNAHFGHCESFAIIDTDMNDKRIVNRIDVDAPPHEPGLLPKWLEEKGVNMIIAGGMGQRAQALFQERNIDVLVGAPCLTPEELVSAFMEGNLQAGVNACDH
jgi:predicted Fe-Mo cluster-binding NifX family protein